jgi:zinc D-Ala-D-Ala carboxypeptidase
MTRLTDNFTLAEFTHSQTAARRGIPNVPKHDSQEHQNLKRTAEVMELVRTILGGNPIMISSGYRNQWVNSQVGGSKSSKHVHGLAVDFTCPGFGSPLDICKALEPHMRELGIDQLIHEFNTWVHLGLSRGEPRHQTLTIDNSGTRSGFA